MTIKTVTDPLVARLMEREQSAREELLECRDALKAIRKACEHTNETYVGHGHNYDVFVCKTCGNERHH